MLNNSSVPYCLCACFPLLQHSYQSPNCGATRCCLTCSGEVSWFPWFHKCLKKIFEKAFHPWHKQRQVSLSLSHGSRNDPEIFPCRNSWWGQRFIWELCGKKLPAWLQSWGPLGEQVRHRLLHPAVPCAAHPWAGWGGRLGGKHLLTPLSPASCQDTWSCQCLRNAFGWCCVLTNTAAVWAGFNFGGIERKYLGKDCMRRRHINLSSWLNFVIFTNVEHIWSGIPLICLLLLCPTFAEAFQT